MKSKRRIVESIIVIFLSFGGFIFVVPEMNKDIAKISTQNGYNSGVVGIAQTMPLVYGVMIIFVVFATIFGGKAVVEYIKYKRWDDFGNRLKLAYTAKFGGENPAFNQEVDAMILQCKTMKKGIGNDTKRSAEMRLKQYAHMCEIPFVIPEEEHLSEVEKTAEFKPIEPPSYSDNKHDYKDNPKSINY